MTDDQYIANHYIKGNLLQKIEAALPLIGKTAQTVSVEDLGPVDEFHIGGRQATQHLLAQLNYQQGLQLLDIGCGLGGTARLVSQTCHCHVTGIDLTPEYIATAKALCEWVKLSKSTHFQQGSALTMPFAADAFDGAYMLHVGMNIEDKHKLFSEVNRVLKSGASFAIYDIMRIETGQLIYPVPWAKDQSMSHLASLEQYILALQDAGFDIAINTNRRDFALTFFKAMAEKTANNGGPLPLGLHILMQHETALKIGNMVSALQTNLIAPIEIIAHKKR